MVSIIIPVFAATVQRLELLDETLATVDRQSPVEFATILPDDRGWDGGDWGYDRSG
ncbi:MAG TPA: hypothetical protein VFK57_07095 [Vicinamibacterales bacterium]|nr:hypothetical protein [Vicinamibacterales bacterium]